MEQQELDALKGSEKLKIEAAVLEIMEAENFSLDKDLGIVSSTENPGNWIMAFTNRKSKLDDLLRIRQTLGSKFSVEITSKSKENFLFRIEAPCQEFFRVAQDMKPLVQTRLTDTQSQPSSVPRYLSS